MRLLRRLFLVAALLAAVDWYVGALFVPHTVVPRYDPPNDNLMDRTGGNNIGILFDLAERRRRAEASPLVVMVGDSTVMSTMQRPPTTLANGVKRVVTEKLHLSRPIDTVEFTGIGMPASDAAVFIAKALGMGADLVTYSLTPRILCMSKFRSSDVDRWVLDRDAGRELGLTYVLESFTAAELTRALIATRWQLFRFHREVGDSLWTAVQSWLSSGPVHRPPSLYPPFTLPPNDGVKSPEPFWTFERCEFGPTDPQFRALRRIIEMCGETGRCLLYHSPINPAGTQLFEAGMLKTFSDRVRAMTRESAAPCPNYAMKVPSTRFLTPAETSPFRVDALHLNEDGRRKLARLLGNDAAVMLAKTLRATTPAGQ